MTYYVYILELSDDSYYTGYTNNIQRRVNEHKNKRGSKYVRSRLPLNLVFYETYNERSIAMRREIAIKKYSRKNKEKLVSTFDSSKISDNNYQ